MITDSTILREGVEASREEAVEVKVVGEITITNQEAEVEMLAVGEDTEMTIKGKMWRKTLTIPQATLWKAMTWRISTKNARTRHRTQTLRDKRTITQRMTRLRRNHQGVEDTEVAGAVEVAEEEVDRDLEVAIMIKRAKI